MRGAACRFFAHVHACLKCAAQLGAVRVRGMQHSFNVRIAHPHRRPMYVLGCFNVVAAFMLFIFRAPDYVDETIDDYAEDHSHVGDRSYAGDRSHTPLRTEGTNGDTTASAINGIPVTSKQ